MGMKRLNWPLWAGFLLTMIAFLSYFFVFIWFPVTRDFPWANFLLFGLAAVLLGIGVRRALAPERTRPRRSKIGAAILTTLSFAIFGFFVVATLILPRNLPESHSAPKVSQQAPDFTLPDTNNKPVSLAELRAAPVAGKSPKGVLLIFYRGSW